MEENIVFLLVICLFMMEHFVKNALRCVTMHYFLFIYL